MTAEEIVEEIKDPLTTHAEGLRMLKQYAHEVLDKAAEVATVEETPCSIPFKDCDCTSYCKHPSVSVNKQPILNLKNKL